MTVSDICKGLPDEFYFALEYVWNIDFSSVPDYEMLIKTFQHLIDDNLTYKNQSMCKELSDFPPCKRRLSSSMFQGIDLNDIIDRSQKKVEFDFDELKGSKKSKIS